MDGQPRALSEPLDRPIWHALTTRQADIAARVGAAVQIRGDYGVFAAAADDSEASRADLLRLERRPEGLWLLERDPVEPPAGMTVHHRRACVQLVGDRGAMTAPKLDFEVTPLEAADGPAALALARLTEPGPFFANTWRMGRFVGVKEGGRLVAMVGERLRPEGFAEVSALCTHPDFRGRGYGAGLLRLAAARIAAEGETPFLHSYADNAGAIALYERFGFRVRSGMMLTVLMAA